MQDLKNHASPLNVDSAWRDLERKMQPRKKRRIIVFWFLMAGLAGAVWVTSQLATSGPLYTIAGTKEIKGNDHLPSAQTQSDTWNYQEETTGIKDKKGPVQNSRSAINAHVKARVRDVATVTEAAMIIKEDEEEVNSNLVAIQEEKEGLNFTIREELKDGATLLPLPTLLPGCEESEELTMPVVLFWTQPQKQGAVWWLIVQGGSGIQHFSYKDAIGETGLVDRVKAIEKPGSVYLGRLGLGRDIGKRYFVGMGLSGFFASEEHTGIVVDTVVGFRENVLISSYKDHDGNLIEAYGNVMTTTVRQTTKKRYPGLSSISLYLGLGKKWLVGKSLIQLEIAYQQRLLAGMWASGLNVDQSELDFAQQYRLKSSSWMADINYSIPVYRNVWMRAGCLFNQTALVAPASYTRHNTSLSAQLGFAWTLK